MWEVCLWTWSLSLYKPVWMAFRTGLGFQSVNGFFRMDSLLLASKIFFFLFLIPSWKRESPAVLRLYWCSEEQNLLPVLDMLNFLLICCLLASLSSKTRSYGRLNTERNRSGVLGCMGTESGAPSTTTYSGMFTLWLFSSVNKCFTCLINRSFDFDASFLKSWRCF